MKFTDYIYLLIIFFIIELVYIQVAKRLKIIDIPNKRSSHITPTIRGGGIVLLFAFISYIFWFNTIDPSYYYFLISLIIVAIVSFIDDMLVLSSKIRIFIHLIALSLLFYSLEIFSISNLPVIILSYILSIGFLNIYNFMDGINGITFLNTLIAYATFYFINVYYISFTDSNLLTTLIIALIVFGFFNFRIKPVCFAGDIGSITIGLSIIYFVILLFLKTDNPLVFLVVACYALDGGWTIVERIYRRENIFKAHKKHLYQILANELNINHLIVSSGYFMVQLLINVFVIYLIILGIKSYLLTLLILVVLSILYFVLKRQISRRKSPN